MCWIVVEYASKIQRNNLSHPTSIIFVNTDPLLYITAIELYVYVTISLNIHAVNLRTYVKYQLISVRITIRANEGGGHVF